MVTTDFIVAIELGSSKIIGMAGRKLSDGNMEILAVASEKSSDFIRKGVIFNLDRTSQALISIIKKLEIKLKANISKVYVGIGGQSLRTIGNSEIYHFEEETKITQAFIDSIMDNNRDEHFIDQEILEVAPQEYKVGINYIADPIGVMTDNIEGRFLNIIARKTLKQNIDKCFQQANIYIADYITAPLALADTVLTPTEKRSGCVLVDFGADTTTVCIYKNNILRHLTVIPLGGNNITKDICSQQIEEENAEELKIKYGVAYSSEVADDTDNDSYNLEGKCSISASLLEDIIQARLNEIINNVSNQISFSRYEDKLLAGAVICGGASNMKNIEEAFTNITKIDKVRFAKPNQYTVKENCGLNEALNNNTAISLLFEGKENCCKVEQPKESHESLTMGLFTDEDNVAVNNKKAAPKVEIDEKKLREDEEKRRFTECANLIIKANSLKESKEYKKALAALEKAKEYNIIEKKTQIRELEEQIKELKDSNSWVSKLGKKFSNLSDIILNDDK